VRDASETGDRLGGVQFLELAYELEDLVSILIAPQTKIPTSGWNYVRVLTRWKQLAAVYLAQQLWNFPPDYVRSKPTPQRLLETVERFEEGLTDKVRVHGSLHATVAVGEAIEVAAAREGRGSGADPILQTLKVGVS
jgi:hypothetical protein